MTFPTDESDTFSSIVDRHDGTPVVGEAHTVPAFSPYEVYLNEGPEVGTLAITGYTEVAYLPTGTGEFFVNYGAGKLVFHSSDASASLSVDYTSLGSILRAENINSLHDALTNTQIEVSSAISGPAGFRVTWDADTPTSVLARGGIWKLSSAPSSPVVVAATVINISSAGANQFPATTSGYYRVAYVLLTQDGVRIKYSLSNAVAATAEAQALNLVAPFDEWHSQFPYVLLAKITLQSFGVSAGQVNSWSQDDIVDMRATFSLEMPAYIFGIRGLFLYNRDLEKYQGVTLTGSAASESLVIHGPGVLDGLDSPFNGSAMYQLTPYELKLWNDTQADFQRIEIDAGALYVNTVGASVPSEPRYRVLGNRLLLVDKDTPAAGPLYYLYPQGAAGYSNTAAINTI